MGILTAVFTILVFFRLGNTYAPETSYTTTSDNRDIVLDFGEYTEISSMSVFLGNLNTRHISISAFNEVTGEWEIFNGDAAIESVFAWNKLDLNYRLRYIGLVFTDAAYRLPMAVSFFLLMQTNIRSYLMSRICFPKSRPI